MEVEKERGLTEEEAAALQQKKKDKPITDAEILDK